MTGKNINIVLGIGVLSFFGCLYVAADGMDKKDIYKEVAGFFSCIIIIMILYIADKPETK